MTPLEIISMEVHMGIETNERVIYLLQVIEDQELKIEELEDEC